MNTEDKEESTTTRIVMLAFEGISAFHLSVPCLVFQDVFISNKPRFELSICAEHQPEFQSGSGFAIRIEHDLSAFDHADIIIIPSWPNHLPTPSQELLDSLQRNKARGAIVVGLCLGSFVLASAGCLDGLTATTHWAFNEQIAKQFPNAEFDPTPLFIDHGDVITSAGTAAALDCCLHIVRRFCGSDVATEIARVMVTAPFRFGGQQQYIPSPVAAKPQQATSLSIVMEQIESQLGQEHSLDSVARRCAMSRRTFTRQFKAAYGCTFGEWLLAQRLSASQQLLESSDYSVSQISALAGFGSESLFRKHFKKAFQVSPSQWRTSFRRLEH